MVPGVTRAVVEGSELLRRVGAEGRLVAPKYYYGEACVCIALSLNCVECNRFERGGLN